MASIFAKIISGEIPAFKVAENENFLAFLDIYPISRGHVLVIPKKETDYLFDITLDAYLELWKFAQEVAKAMDKVIDCKRIGVAVIGLEVPHAHIHLVPLNSISDINFESPKLSLPDEEMDAVAQMIRKAL